MSIPQHPEAPFTILAADAVTPPEIAPRLAPSGSGVIDEEGFRVIEVARLFTSVRRTQTHTGACVLYRSLSQPLAGREALMAKQAALRRLDQDAVLREQLTALVNAAATHEKGLYDLLYARFIGLMGQPAGELEREGYGYSAYNDSAALVASLVEGAEKLQVSDVPYLEQRLQRIRQFRQSRAWALLCGPVYRSEQQVLVASEKPWYVPAVRFRPSLFKPFALLGGVALLVLAMTFVPMLLDIASSIAPALWLFLLPIALLYIPMAGSFDRDGIIYPLRLAVRQSEAMADLVDALGELDELLGFLAWRDDFPLPATLPVWLEDGPHRLRAEAMRNPVLALENPDYVGNDITLDSERLTFITGPNSGGKTAFSKTLAQCQLLAQAGGFVPCLRLELAVADHIDYQVPETSQLADGEGRFGTELKRTRDLFLRASERSLVIMDELSEGTTHEEKINISRSILEGFTRKGCSALLITHNHELVDDFSRRRQGQTLQVEFAGDHPTYHLVPGISRVSHADRIARKIGFSREDIDRHLGGG